MTTLMTRGCMALGITALLAAPMPSSHLGGAGIPTVVADTSDRAFAQQLVDGNQTEIREARAFMNTAKDPDVRKFAQRLDDDHSNALKKLHPIAKRLGAVENDPQAMTAMGPGRTQDSGMKDRMAPRMGDSSAARPMPAMSDSAMKMGMGVGAMDSTGRRVAGAAPGAMTDDKAFVDAMVTGHQQLLDDLKQNEGQIRDKELKKFVNEFRMSVESHLTRAKLLQAQLGKTPAQ
jgi:predicted outer membrane protein